MKEIFIGLLIAILIGFLFLGIPYIISYFVATRNQKVKKDRPEGIKKIGFWGTLFFNVTMTPILFTSKIDPIGIVLFYIIWGVLFSFYLSSNFANHWPLFLKNKSKKNSSSQDYTLASKSPEYDDTLGFSTDEIETVKNFIQKNELRKALKSLGNSVNLTQEQENRILNFQRRYEDIESKSLLHEISDDTREAKMNRLTNSILLFVQENQIQPT